jgi:hypothetical protein
MLRTHRSLEAYCTTLWWRWLVFFVFPCNGAPVEWNWQGKTEVLGVKPVPVPLCPPQIPYGLTPESNPCLHGERPATNCLRHGTAYRIRFLGRVLLLTHLYGRREKRGWISKELTQCCNVVTSSAARSSNPGRDSMIWMLGNTSHVRPSRTRSSPGQAWSMLPFKRKCWLYTRLTTQTRKPSECIFPSYNLIVLM